MKQQDARLLILAHALDTGAQAVRHALAPRVRQRTLWLRPEWLGQLQWSHRVDRHGTARTTLRGPGAATLDCTTIGLLWNRIRWLPQPNFRASKAADRDYAGAELEALVASWLAALGERAEPRMRAQLSVVPTLHALHWRTAARRCGLRLDSNAAAAGVSLSVLRTPLGLYGSGASEWPHAFGPACHALADELGVAVVELGLAGSADAPRLVRVDIAPALNLPGHAQAVARWLEQRIDALAAAPAVPIVVPIAVQEVA